MAVSFLCVCVATGVRTVMWDASDARQPDRLGGLLGYPGESHRLRLKDASTFYPDGYPWGFAAFRHLGAMWWVRQLSHASCYACPATAAQKCDH
eukprot:9479163-Pyramimonas_sp.AAC.1